MEFDEAWALLERAAAIGDGLTKNEAKTGIEAGYFRLYTGHRSAALVSCDQDVWRIGLGGGDLAELKALEAVIDYERQEKGVPKLQIVGRRGWLRALPGYAERAVVMEKT